MRSTDLPAESRPREKLLRAGQPALSSSELLAVLLGSGTGPAGSALAVGARVLEASGGLPGLERAGVRELEQVPGVGRATALRIKAALELGRRLLSEESADLASVSRPEEVYRLLAGRLARQPQEMFWSLALDSRNRVVRESRVAEGSADRCLVHPREVFREAVRESAVSVIVAHNHPSGDPEPSDEDVRLTRRLAEAGRIVGIQLLDHVVLGDGSWVSLRERGAV